MKKILLLLITCCHVFQSNAQTSLQTPNRTDWEAYFNSRFEKIQTKLYNLALQGKVKAYVTDSLKSFYTPEHLKYRGSNKYSKYMSGIDDYPDSAFIPFNPKNIQCIWFIQKTNTDASEINQQTSLTGIALVYQPSVGSFMTLPHPLMNIAINDLKKNLTEDEFLFLSVMYHYSLHSNVMIEQNVMEDEDPYSFYNLYPTSLFAADTSLIKKVTGMLSYSPFFINEMLYKNPEAKLIFNHQTNKLISNAEFGTTYYSKIKTKMVTGIIDNKEVLKDTIYHQPLPLFDISSISIDPGTGMQFNYTLKGEDGKLLTFSIAFKNLKKHKIAPNQLWFFEDYFRWKLK